MPSQSFILLQCGLIFCDKNTFECRTLSPKKLRVMEEQCLAIVLITGRIKVLFTGRIKNVLSCYNLLVTMEQHDQVRARGWSGSIDSGSFEVVGENSIEKDSNADVVFVAPEHHLRSYKKIGVGEARHSPSNIQVSILQSVEECGMWKRGENESGYLNLRVCSYQWLRWIGQLLRGHGDGG